MEGEATEVVGEVPDEALAVRETESSETPVEEAAAETPAVAADENEGQADEPAEEAESASETRE